MNLAKLWSGGWKMGTYAHDLLASMVVFLVALPLCLGIAVASGVPPALGLITGIVGGIVVGALSGSPLQVSGPAAGLTVLVFELVNRHGLEMLGPILIVAALVQLAAGALRIGQWFRAISPAVVYGMLAGIGVLILASQFHVMLDDKPRANGLANLLAIPEAFYRNVIGGDAGAHQMAALLGLGTIALIVLWNRFRPQSLRLVPAPLIAAGAATVVANLVGLPVAYVDVPNRLTDAVTLPTWDRLASLGSIEMLMAGLTLAFVASAETLLSAAAVDRMHTGPRTNYDKELVAQGFGNLVCGVLGALPMTGVIVRSSANVQAGARTRWSAVLHGVWLLAIIGSVPVVLEKVPTAALAAILVHTGCKLVSLEKIRNLAQYGRLPLAIYFATLGTIVAVDLLTGVLVGVGLSLAKLLHKMSHLDIQLHVDDQQRRAELRLAGAATFLRLPKLADAVDRVPDGYELHVYVDRLHQIDHACMDLLASWRKQCEAKGCELRIEWDELMMRYRGMAPQAG
jgi:MFS superfamily sulfate permease-like transporter